MTDYTNPELVERIDAGLANLTTAAERYCSMCGGAPQFFRIAADAETASAPLVTIPPTTT